MQLCCCFTNFVALLHGCYYTGIFIVYNMLNIKLIVSYLEIMCNVKTFIDIKKAPDLRCSVQMVGCGLCLINEV
jgi:hypothetical protein